MTYLLMCCFFVLTVVCDTSTEPEKKPVFPREFDFRFTSYEDLLTDTESFKTFQNENFTGSVQLTVDVPRNQLLVGARDVLLQLSLDDLITIDSVLWMPDETSLTLCSTTGFRKKEDCHNYIRVVLVHNASVFLCGTYANSPKCCWRNAENLTVIEQDEFQAVGYLPYTPDHNSTAVLTSNKVYYSGTVYDVQGRNEIIFRPESKDYRALLTKKNREVLYDPQFVSAYEVDEYVYFFFREVAFEYTNCGKRIYSRVARVCKSDQGGTELLKENWTTFVKARLNCFISGDYPFYFDEIQDTYLLETETEKFFFAIFTTPENSIAGSAVCFFNMTSFKSVFNGTFMYQESGRHVWESDPAKTRPLKCPDNKGTDKRSSEDNKPNKGYLETMNYQLMHDAVQPQTMNPLLLGKNERWTHVVVDVVKGKGQHYYVMFVATLDGFLRKMTYLPQTSSSCLIEEYRIVPGGEHKPVKNMRISREKGAVFVTVDGEIIRIPVQRCGRFTDQDLCKNSMDPYCGWNGALNKCTTAPDNDPSIHFWMQDIISCPIIEHPIDGGWSEWSPWATCQQMVSEPSAGDCQCHTRSCDSPKPAFGGKPCDGATVEVTNCTAHGQWTDWTAWSKCSVTCGHNGTRSRQRYCSNPPPRHGGRDCIGSDEEVGYCRGNPTCPDPPIDGHWTMWAAWSRCTANCNGGIQTRKRQCSQPPPSEDGRPCEGNTQEWRMCNTLHCPELSQVTPWTMWIKTNETHSGYFQQRFRFLCKANVPDQTMIKTDYVKTHSRFCFNNDGTCHRAENVKNMTQDGQWSSWQPWSVCSQVCGGGAQTRRRSCDNPQPMGFGADCQGHHMESRQCNMHSCQGEWSCWSEFSQCSASCGPGSRVRVRHCISPIPGTQYKNPCVGLDSDYRPCYSKPCNMSAGWDHWSAWTRCQGDGLQYRRRECLLESPGDSDCQGSKIEYTTCIYRTIKTKLTPVKQQGHDIQSFTLFHLVVVSSGSFLFGIMVTIGLYLCFKSCRSFQKFDLEKERKKNGTLNNGKRKCGSWSSQISLDFLTINNKVYDSATLQLSKQDKYVSSKNTYNSMKRKEAQLIDRNQDV